MQTSHVSRRKFLQISALGMAGAVVAACQPAVGPQPAVEDGEEVPGQESVEIVFVTTESSGSGSQLYAPVYEEFHEVHPEITVEWLGVVAQGGWGAYFDKLSVIIAGGEQVDMGKIPTEGGRLAVARGLTQPLDDFIENSTELGDYFEDVSPELADVFVYGGKTYGLPYDFNNMMIWFNTNRLAEEGLEVPPEDWTFADFREYTEALTKRDGDDVTHYGFSFWTAPFGLCPWLFNNGLEGMLGGDDMDVPLMTDPKYVEVVQFLYDLMYVDGTVPRSDSQQTVSFESGTVAMQMAGRWPISGYIDNDFEDYEVQYWPQELRRVTEVGCGSWPIFADSKYPNEAWTFEEWLLRKESIEYFVSQGANIPSRRSIGYSDDFTALPANSGQLWYESIDREDIPVISVTSPPDFSEMEQISNRHLSQIFADEVGVEEGLVACEQDMQEMIDRRPPEWAGMFG